MEIQELLESIGLTKQEAKCFIALYELKESKIGELSKKSKIATANIYPVLDSLMNKGLTSFKIVNNIRIYMPSSLESINELIKHKQEDLDQKKEMVKKAISSLHHLSSIQDSFQNYKFFVGVPGIKSLWNEVLDVMRQTKKKSILKVYGMTKESSENLRGFYNEFHEKRVKLGHEYYLVASLEDKEHAALRRKQLAKVKLMEMQNEGAFGVFEDLFIVYYSVGKNPIGFLIIDRKIADTFDQIFEKMWKI